MGIDIVRLMPKNMNRGAYRGELTCPVCHSRAIRFVEDITPYRRRYRCRKCGLPFQYDISNRVIHPYAPFKKGKFQTVVRLSRGGKFRR